MKGIVLVLLLIFAGISITSMGQSEYNKNSFVFDLSLGNGIYGVGSVKAGAEFPCFKHQKWGLRIGGGLDIGPKIGMGAYISPYEWDFMDILVSCDFTRVFGGTYLYHNDKEKVYSPDNYSFDNTNLIISCVSARFFLENSFALYICTGWAFGVTDPNIQHLSGPGLKVNKSNISNSLLGGYRAEFGLTFRILYGKETKVVDGF